MSSKQGFLFDNFGPGEEKDIKSVPGGFSNETPEDANYRVDYRDGNTYAFKVDKSPLGVKFYYRGSLKHSRKMVPLPSTLYEEIRQQNYLHVGDLESVDIVGRRF